MFGVMPADRGAARKLSARARLGTGRPHSIAQAVTKHLEVLSHAGLVRDFRQGRERLWQPEAKRLDEARLYLDTISSAGTRRSRD